MLYLKIRTSVHEKPHEKKNEKLMRKVERDNKGIKMGKKFKERRGNLGYTSFDHRNHN